MKLAKRVEQLVEILKGHRVMIQMHNYPDPDAMASAFGLQFLLRQYAIESDMVYIGNITKIADIRLIQYTGMEFYSPEELGLKEDDYIVLVDAQKYNKNCVDLIGDEVACIDHHPTMVGCEYQYKDVRRVGSCSTLIAEYILEAGIIPTMEVASALVYGIKMDTANFVRGVTELDIRMYYELFPYVDQEFLSRIMINQIEFKDLVAYGAAIKSISLYKDIGYASIPFDCPNELIAIISDFILALDMVNFCVIYSEREEGYKFSVRSERKDLDAGKISFSILQNKMKGNGGGHSFMAGGFLPKEKVKLLGDNPRKQIEMYFNQYIYPEDKDYEKNTIYIETAD